MDRGLIAITMALALVHPVGAQQAVAIQAAESLYERCLDYERWAEAPNRRWPSETVASATACVQSIIAMNTMLNDLSRKGWLSPKICSHTISPREAVHIYLQFMRTNAGAMGGFSSDSYHAAMMDGFICQRHPWQAD